MVCEHSTDSESQIPGHPGAFLGALPGTRHQDALGEVGRLLPVAAAGSPRVLESFVVVLRQFGYGCNLSGSFPESQRRLLGRHTKDILTHREPCFHCNYAPCEKGGEANLTRGVDSASCISSVLAPLLGQACQGTKPLLGMANSAL